MTGRDRTFALAALTLLVANAEVGAHSSDEELVDDEGIHVMVDVAPASPNDGTTLAASLHAVFQTVGQPEWSMARLQGVMGHAFQFQMKEDGSHVMHDALDWSHAVRIVPDLGQFTAFDANRNNPVEDVPAYKRQARDLVVQSLERGVPALAWQPMSLDQKQSEHPAHSAYCWGIIVGYNAAEETYTIRHPFVAVTYTVRYDELGPADPGGWFGIRVWEEANDTDPRQLHLQSLRNAVAFANGTMFTDENFVMADGRKIAPYGLAAYDTWINAFANHDVSTGPSGHHAKMLHVRRVAAAAYMRELVAILPEAEAALQSAATYYDAEVEAVVALREIIAAAQEAKAFSLGQKSAVQRLIGEALAADRQAVAQIEAVLARVGG